MLPLGNDCPVFGFRPLKPDVAGRLGEDCLKFSQQSRVPLSYLKCKAKKGKKGKTKIKTKEAKKHKVKHVTHTDCFEL